MAAGSGQDGGVETDEGDAAVIWSMRRAGASPGQWPWGGRDDLRDITKAEETGLDNE